MVDAKWPTIKPAFRGFKVERDGGFRKHLRSFDDYEALATDLKKRFKFVGDSGTFHFLRDLASFSRDDERVVRLAALDHLDLGARTRRA